MSIGHTVVSSLFPRYNSSVWRSCSSSVSRVRATRSPASLTMRNGPDWYWVQPAAPQADTLRSPTPMAWIETAGIEPRAIILLFSQTGRQTMRERRQ